MRAETLSDATANSALVARKVQVSGANKNFRTSFYLWRPMEVDDRVRNTRNNRIGIVIEIKGDKCVVEYQDEKSPGTEEVKTKTLKKV